MTQAPVTMDELTSRGDPALLGRTIAGKYTIDKFLGGGSMGAVYRARQAALEKNVAVKVMHQAMAMDPNFVGRFHREAKAASRLDHPNSMRVLDFGEEPDGLLYIAMEYVEGRDLYRVIHEDWPIANADVADLLMQALAAIAVAHEMGVIHRDLKPENLMILRGKNDEEVDTYVVKVCDFGIAKITESDETSGHGKPGHKLTTQGLVVGTPEYMSPEQARGEPLDARSDLYSMGIILYQLLTGRTPFMADTALAVVLKHITEMPAPPSVHYPDVHPGLAAVCLVALAKDRGERYQTARAMRSAIREALDGRLAALPTPDAAQPTNPVLPSVAAAISDERIPVSSARGVAVASPASLPQVAQARSRYGTVLTVMALSFVAGIVGVVAFYNHRPARASHGGEHAIEESQAPKAVPLASVTTTSAPAAVALPGTRGAIGERPAKEGKGQHRPPASGASAAPGSPGSPLQRRNGTAKGAAEGVEPAASSAPASSSTSSSPPEAAPPASAPPASAPPATAAPSDPPAP